MGQIVLLNDINYEGCVNLPLFKIEYLKQDIDITSYDALIFTSKNAIKAIDSFNESWKEVPSYCIAPKTAKVVENYGGSVEFIGKSSHGNEFAKELIPLLKGKKALYLRAKKTVSSIVEIIAHEGIDIDSATVYQTACVETQQKAPQDNSVIVFTAPSTIECFFKNFSWNVTYKAVVIGNTTAKYMPENISFSIASKQSIDACVEEAKRLL